MIVQNNGPLKVAYLFGTGATHAEKSLQYKLTRSGLNSNKEAGPELKKLLAADISRAVFLKIKEYRTY